MSVSGGFVVDRRLGLGPAIAMACVLAVLGTPPASAQEWTPLNRGSDNIDVLGHLPLGGPLNVEWTPLNRGSDNIDVLGHLPLGGPLNVGDMDVEPEMSRPFAYVGRMRYGTPGPTGMDIIGIEDPERPTLLYEWRIEWRGSVSRSCPEGFTTSSSTSTPTVGRCSSRR